MKVNLWEAELNKEIAQIEHVFMTSRQFEEIIKEVLNYPLCPLVGLRYNIEAQPPFQNWAIGIEGTGEPDVHTYMPNDSRGTHVRMKYWLKEKGPAIQQETQLLLEKLFESFWKSSIRTASAGMWDLKRHPATRQYADHTVDGCLRDEHPCSLLFCDLDDFGEVNKVHDHPTGDRVVKEFGTLVERYTREEGVLLHRNTGDEFIILLPEKKPEDALLLAYEISRVVKAHDFKVDPLRLGFSIGAAYIERSGTYETLDKDADVAMSKYAKKPKKGRTRFLTSSKSQIPSDSVLYELDLAHCIIRGSILSQYPFGNTWLNGLSRVVYELALNDAFDCEKIREAINDFISWADLELLVDGTIKSSIPREYGVDTAPGVGVVDYCFAIAHGLLRASIMGNSPQALSSITVNYNTDMSNAGLVYSNGEERVLQWSLKPSGEMGEIFEIGNSWEIESKNGLVSSQARRAILIQIGHGDPGIPLSIFADRIIVDDRPVRGGGLPDFWEATIARLVAQVLKNPNIGAVYLVGNQQHAKQTVKKLKTVSSWTKDNGLTSYKTAMSIQDIQTAVSVLGDEIELDKKQSEIVADLSNMLKSSYRIVPLAQKDVSMSERFLRREIQLDEMALGKNDGFRVRTIAEAYPLVMEIARKAPEENCIIDQAGYQIRELVDFKVHLTNPCQDMVPSFYKSEKASLDDYYNREFEKTTGLFGKVFDETGQLNAVLDHVVNSIKDSSRQYATRRAVLIIPHVLDGGGVAPLGLISIRILSRFHQDQIRLHYSYTWRSVEAFIGFPYSLYGSVRFGQYLTDRIKAKLDPDKRRTVQMGYISYIAHSLHLFADDYGQNIARRIIEDASY